MPELNFGYGHVRSLTFTITDEQMNVQCYLCLKPFSEYVSTVVSGLLSTFKH